ncbi:MAG: 3-hydroxyacyl-ACP dehydratase [Burkholderiaceae bacterium]
MSTPGRAQLAIARDAAYFAGHFPGDPIVPGAQLLDLVVQTLQARPGELGGPIEVVVAKFLHPVRPGDQPVLTWEPQRGTIRFELRVEGRCVASGAVRAVASPGPGG